MAKTYSPSDLALADPKSLAWALAWARRLAADVPTGSGAWPDHSLADEEWQAWLSATALTDADGNTWYRPHEAAARVIEDTPMWVTQISVGGVAQTFRNAAEAAQAIRRSGRWIDRLIAVNGGPDAMGIAPRW